jgi:hypothetical protein
MTKKTHLTKQEEAQVEHGLQVRSDNPSSPLSNHIWYNSSENKLSMFIGGIEKRINVRVLSGDPSSPVENEVWINTSASALKFHSGGVTTSINFGAGIVNTDVQDNGELYLSILDDAELALIADVSMRNPNFLIDSFQAVKESSTYTNTIVEASRLALPSASNSGTYSRTEKMSNFSNSVEGVAVVSAQAFAPHLVTHNGGIVSPTNEMVVFYGDLTSYFAANKKMLCYELYTIDSVDKHLYVLDSEHKPLVLTIAAVTYDAVLNRTSVEINSSGTDLTLGYGSALHYAKIRFINNNIKVEASAGTTLTELDIKEAHATRYRRLIGETNLTDLTSQYAGSVNSFVCKASPSGQYVFVMAAVERTSNSNTIVIWYSTDYGKSFKQADNFSSNLTEVGGDEAYVHSNAFLSEYSNAYMSPRGIEISDDGKVIFTHYIYNASAYPQNACFFAKLTSPTFDYRPIASSGYKGGFIQRGATWYGNSCALAMDFSNNILAAVFSQNGDGYVNFYSINWTNMSSSYGSNAAIGGSTAGAQYPIVTFWKTYEGEQQLFIALTNSSNAYNYAWSIRYSEVAAGMAASTTVTARGAFATSPTSGRNTDSTFTHLITSSGSFVDWCFSDDGNELLIYKHDTDGEQYLITLNFGVTSATTFLYHGNPSNYKYNTVGSLIRLDAAALIATDYDGNPVSTDLAYLRRYSSQRMIAKGNTIHVNVPLRKTVGATYTSALSTYMKIPDYKQLLGLHYVNVPGAQSNVSLNLPADAAGNGTRFYQSVTIPTSSNYPTANNYSTFYTSGLVPIRTIALLMGKNYATKSAYKVNGKISVKLYGANGDGTINLSSVLATSKNAWIVNNLTQYAENNWFEFVFDNVQLAPGTTFYIGVEPDWDMSKAANYNPTGLALTTRGFVTIGARAGTGFPRCYRGLDNDTLANISLANFELWYRIFDFFKCPVGTMQDNQYWYTASDCNADYFGADSESTIAWYNKTSSEMTVTYKNGAATQAINNANYGTGMDRTWYGKITDSLGANFMPVFSAPSVLGVADSHEKSMLFAVALGSDDSRTIDPRTGVADSSKYNYRAIGGIPIDPASNTNLSKAITASGLTYGVTDDSDFIQGKCLSFKGNTYLYYDQYTRFLRMLGSRDFVVQAEIKPDSTDLDLAYHYIFGMEGFARLSIYQNKLTALIWDNVGTTYTYQSSELMTTAYRVVRLSKSSTSGIKLSYSFDRVNFFDLTLTGSNPSEFSGGRTVGYAATSWSYLYIGSHTSALPFYGKIGEFRIYYNTATPPSTSLTKLNYDLHLPRLNVINGGIRICALTANHHNATSYRENSARMTFLPINHGNLNSIVATNDQLFKFNEPVNEGQNAKLQITMERVSNKDPNNVQGILVNYLKK